MRRGLASDRVARDERRRGTVRIAGRTRLGLRLHILSREPLVANDFQVNMFDEVLTSGDAQVTAIGVLRDLDVRRLENVYQRVPSRRVNLMLKAVQGHIDALIASDGWEAVLCELHHPNTLIRFAAVAAIEDVGGARAIAALAEIAADEEQDDDVRGCAVRALANFGDPRGVSALLTICEDDGASQELTDAALEALAAIGGLQAKAALRGLSERHELQWLREAARKALDRIDD